MPVYFDFGSLGIWHLLEFFPDNRVGLFAYIDRYWLIDACKVGTEIPLTDIPLDAEEEYLELRQMVEVRADDHEIQGTYTEEW